MGLLLFFFFFVWMFVSVLILAVSDVYVVGDWKKKICYLPYINNSCFPLA